MDENKNSNFVIKQSLFEPLTSCLLTPLFLSLMSLFIIKDLILSLLLYLLFSLFLGLYYFSTFKTFYFEDNGITIEDKLNSFKITWDDILSMAAVYNIFHYIRYQIRTTSKTIDFPPPENINFFESFMLMKANLELEGKNMADLGNHLDLNIKLPRIRRWRKKGQ